MDLLTASMAAFMFITLECFTTCYTKQLRICLCICSHTVICVATRVYISSTHKLPTSQWLAKQIIHKYFITILYILLNSRNIISGRVRTVFLILLHIIKIIKLFLNFVGTSLWCTSVYRRIALCTHVVLLPHKYSHNYRKIVLEAIRQHLWFAFCSIAANRSTSSSSSSSGIVLHPTKPSSFPSHHTTCPSPHLRTHTHISICLFYSHETSTTPLLY